MTRKAIIKPAAASAGPNLPQHNLPEPFASLQAAGYEEQIDLYQKIVETTKPTDQDAMIDKLTDMALDETYYSYSAEDTEDDVDPRCFAPLQAVRALCYFAETAAPAIPRLIPLFATDDMMLREELPLLFTCIGLDAMLPLMQVMIEGNEDIYLRDGAAESLVSLASEYAELTVEVRMAIEVAIKNCEDPELTGYFITALMDLGASQSLPLIRAEFENLRVDTEVVTLDQVEEHFNSIAREVAKDPKNLKLIHVIDGDEEDDYREPYLAPEKIGRNDPCPCGSGKKYKKCCGSGG